MRSISSTLLVCAVLWICPTDNYAQQQFTDYRALEGEIQVGPEEDITVSRTARGYTLLLPEDDREIRGVIVFFEGRRITLENIPEPMQLHTHAFEQGLGVLYVSTGHPVDFYFEDERMHIARDLIRRALRAHDLPSENLAYAGFSLGGTRALKFTVFCQANPSACRLKPDSVAVVDAPLDMTRFWRVTERAEHVDFHRLGAGEGRWVSYYLEQNLGGTPREAAEAYREYSPYTYGWEHVDRRGGNARHLTDIPIRAYTEPDVNWWIEHRRKSYYSMNAVDMAGLVNDLKILGNDEVELITTHNERSDVEGSPHSWSIVDNRELVDWIASTLE